MLEACLPCVVGSFCAGIASVFVGILSKPAAFWVAACSIALWALAILMAGLERVELSCGTAAFAIPFVLPGIFAAYVFRPVQSAKRNDGAVCGECGYNLTGLAEPRCPECGTPFPQKWLALQHREPSVREPMTPQRE